MNALEVVGPGEVRRVASAGGGAIAFAAKVKSNYAFNVYKIRVVEILAEGQTPAELGSEMKATNLAESFAQQGQLGAGKYVLVCATGDKNVFYATP